jgi:hypothetical protein
MRNTRGRHDPVVAFPQLEGLDAICTLETIDP